MRIFDKLMTFAACGDEEREPAYYPPLKMGDYAAAIPMLKRAIARDDAHAMAVYAALLAMGRGVARDPGEACDWFRQAAVRGDIFAQTAFGQCLVIGFGTAPNQTEAAYWLYRAGKAGYRRAIIALQDLALRDRSVIGVHFSMREYLELTRRLRRSVVVRHRED